MTFSDDDLKRLKKELPLIDESGRWLTTQDEVEALLARLEADESLLDRALKRLKLINGPESKCVYADSDIVQCENHRLIREIEAWRKAAAK